MSNEVTCYEIEGVRPKNGGSVKLGATAGFVKIACAEDGRTIMVEDRSYGEIAETGSTDISQVDRYAALGFVLNAGLRRTKLLTMGTGYYFGQNMQPGTPRIQTIEQSDLDLDLFKQITRQIDTDALSSDDDKVRKAMQLNNSLATYNDAQLMYPEYYGESYLSLLRILEANCKLDPSIRAIGRDFSLSVAKKSPKSSVEIHKSVCAVKAFVSSVKNRVDIAENIAVEEGAKFSSDPVKNADFSSLNKEQRFVFACMFSAYQYRNHYVHQGFPFPDSAKTVLGLSAGITYLSPSLGSSHILRYNPLGVSEGELLEMHEVISFSDPLMKAKFKDEYLVLLPTWHFLNKIVREVLLSQFGL